MGGRRPFVRARGNFRVSPGTVNGQRNRGADAAESKHGSACGIRTRDLRLERAVSWASRRTRHVPLQRGHAGGGVPKAFKAASSYQTPHFFVNRSYGGKPYSNPLLQTPFLTPDLIARKPKDRRGAPRSQGHMEASTRGREPTRSRHYDNRAPGPVFVDQG